MSNDIHMPLYKGVRTSRYAEGGSVLHRTNVIMYTHQCKI